MSEVQGKWRRDVWHRTGRVTFVVNQPPTLPLLPPPGFDNHASQPHGNTEDCKAGNGLCSTEVLCKVLLEVDQREATSGSVALQEPLQHSHFLFKMSCGLRQTEQKQRRMGKFPLPACVCVFV